MTKQYKMAQKIHLLILLTIASAKSDPKPSRWSRQISSYTSDISDWVPLTRPIERPEQPIKRQAIAQPRILSEPFPTFTRPTGFSQEFPNAGFFQNNQQRPLYLQSVPTASQNYLSEQGFGQQGIKFALGTPTFPLNQGFVNNQGFTRFPQNPMKFEQFPQPVAPITQPKFQPLPAQKTVNPIPTQSRPEAPKFMDGYTLENSSSSFGNKKPQSLQKIKFESNQFGTFLKPPANAQKSSNVEREEVQLLYVPVDSLNRGLQSNYKTITNTQSLNRDLYGSSAIQRPDTLSQSFTKPQRSQPSFQSVAHDYFNSYNNQKFGVPPPPQITFGTTQVSHFPTIPTTQKPKKLKPHQPPLAVFLAQESTKPESIKVADVLSTLKGARNIAVLDSVSPANSPKVFIGPSTLLAPNNYVKFELPYLSNLENTDKKLRQLPFFVAPLSYNTPNGFAKIPFPSPHVGSVIVNALLKESNPQAPSTPNADVIPNAYTPNFNTKQTPFTNSVTTKPTISYFSTSAPSQPTQQNQFQGNSFSFEPQSVTPIEQSTEREPNIITASSPPANSQFIQSMPSPPLFKPKAPPKLQHDFPETNNYAQRGQFQNNPNFNTQSRTPPPTSTRLTSKTPSTFSNVLLETHNPFSINQAFDFSSPLDFHGSFDEGKRDFSTQSYGSQTPKIQQEVSTESEFKPSSPNYLQNYSPEIHYQSEILSSRFPSFDADSYRTTQSPSPSSVQTSESQSPLQDYSPENNNQDQTPAPNPDYIQTTQPPPEYVTRQSSKFEESNKITPSRDNNDEPSSTTTRRPIRGRGRPRSTTPRTESDEYSSRASVTRKPLRERRPLPPRVRPSTEKPVISRRQPDASTTSESSVNKSTRLRTRGRHQYKPTESSDEAYEVSKKSKTKSAEEDIAYQRDVLHQNYPVTIQERISTVDINAITSPSPRISSTRLLQTESSSLEDSYVTEQPSRSTFDKTPIKEIELPVYTSRTVEIEAPNVPRFSATINEQPSYNTKTSSSQYDDKDYEKQSTPKFEQNLYVSRSSNSQIRTDSAETAATTETARFSTYSSKYSDFDLKERQKQAQEEEATTVSSYESSKVGSSKQIFENNNLSEEHTSQQEEINTIPPTTVSRPKIRPRPLPNNQQNSPTESISPETSKKPARVDVKRRPLNPVTYRPAFNRRTTMKIEEIEAELKTKPVNSRLDNIDRHPVYRPEPTTEPALTTPITPKKPTQYRRRRPQSSFSSSTTSETPNASKKTTYETKNRFRGRRPTSEKSNQNQEEATTVSSQKPQLSRLNQRTRLSERFNRKQSTEIPILEEQDADSSIHRPKIVPYEGKVEENWSPDSFKPYNPNDIADSRGESEYRNKQINIDNEEPEIVTAGNDYEEILLTVTPASNNLNKKPEIPPTLEAFVEQSKGSTTADGSSIESVIEEMMKSLEEQDEDEYTRNVMKHEHGEIGEIPPESVVDSTETVPSDRKQYLEPVTDSSAPESPQNNQETGERKTRRRGYWKKVRVRPVTPESFEVAESQFYSKTVNHLGDDIKPTKTILPKDDISSFGNNESQESIEIIESTTVFPVNSDDIETLKDQVFSDSKMEDTESTKVYKLEESTTNNSVNPGDMDLGTGSPDPTIEDVIYPTTTEVNNGLSMFSNAGGSIMDYLFGFSSEDKNHDSKDLAEKDKANDTVTTEKILSRESTTETSYIPSEITESTEDADEKSMIENFESIKEVKTEKSTVTEIHKDVPKYSETTKTTQVPKISEVTESSEITTSSEANWDSSGVVTSMSTEISHETEICYRGKCIKTTKDIV